MTVYIEDTDAYGILYNGNYLRNYDRALHLSNSVSDGHEGWSIVSLGKQKFISSPTLGSSFIVQAMLTGTAENIEIFDMEMKSPDGTIYNSVQDLKIARPSSNANGDANNIFSLMNADPFTPGNGSFDAPSASFRIYRDEIDAHWTGHLPLRNVLNLFERHRSIILGGPRELQKMKDEGVLAVVTGIGDCCLIDEGVLCYPGQVLTVDTCCVVKRRGMVVDCFQTLKGCKSSGGQERRIAQGKVTLMMIDSITRKPTSKLPASVRERLDQLASSKTQ